MDKVDNKNEIVEAVVKAGILGVIAASVRALLADEKPAQKIRTFFAGVLVSLLLGFLLNDTNLSPFAKNAITSVSAAFISTIWPMLERLATSIAKKYLTKKGNDVV